MNIVEEVNKLIANYFRKHNNIINSHDIRHEMIHDRDAQLDAIDLVCDIANVYNSAIYQCAFNHLEEVLKMPFMKTDTVSVNQRSYTPQEIGEAISKSAKAIYNNLYHIKGEDK